MKLKLKDPQVLSHGIALLLAAAGAAPLLLKLLMVKMHLCILQHLLFLFSL